MNSLLLTCLARLLVWVMLALSVYLLYRGHHAPGGGFIGGLVAAAAIALAAKGLGQERVYRSLPLHPTGWMILGLTCAVTSGFFALLNHQAWMTGQWWLGPWSSILLFDTGVFLMVFGATLIFFFALEEGDT